jgi:hypothetical protein
VQPVDGVGAGLAQPAVAALALTFVAGAAFGVTETPGMGFAGRRPMAVGGSAAPYGRRPGYLGHPLGERRLGGPRVGESGEGVLPAPPREDPAHPVAVTLTVPGRLVGDRRPERQGYRQDSLLSVAQSPTRADGRAMHLGVHHLDVPGRRCVRWLRPERLGHARDPIVVIGDLPYKAGIVLQRFDYSLGKPRGKRWRRRWPRI